MHLRVVATPMISANEPYYHIIYIQARSHRGACGGKAPSEIR